jgi:hypothetical protein
MNNIVVYHGTVPNAKNQEKIDVLNFFGQGARAVGDTVTDVRDRSFYTAKVAVIQGWVTDKSETKSHLALRNRVIQEQIKNNRYVVAIDSNLFLYADTKNSMHYLRFSFNGIFPTTGIYCDSDPDPRRWKKISKDLNIAVKDYRTAGNHILILLQRNGGWSMGGLDVQDWCNQTIAKIRQHTDRPIVVRPHPGDKQASLYLAPGSGKCRIDWNKKVKLSTKSNLLDDLRDCWAAVNHNSSPVVAAAIEGVPVFVTDPVQSQCKEIANTDFSLIEQPQMLNRQAWVERLAMSHWNFDELKTGQCWSHMRKFI